MNKNTRNTIIGVINKIKKDAEKLNRLYHKGVSPEALIESTDMPSELIDILTDIPVEKHEYVIPVQVVTEGYVKVKAASIDDAIAAASCGLGTIKIDPAKLSTSLSDTDKKVLRIVPDAELIDLYSKSEKTMDFKFMEHEIKSLADLIGDESPDNIISILMSGEPLCDNDDDNESDDEDCKCDCLNDFLKFLASIVCHAMEQNQEHDETEQYKGDIEYYEGDDIDD